MATKKNPDSFSAINDYVTGLNKDMNKMINAATTSLANIPKLAVKLKKERVIDGKAASISYTDTGAIIIEFKDDKGKEASHKHYESL